MSELSPWSHQRYWCNVYWEKNLTISDFPLRRAGWVFLSLGIFVTAQKGHAITERTGTRTRRCSHQNVEVLQSKDAANWRCGVEQYSPSCYPPDGKNALKRFSFFWRSTFGKLHLLETCTELDLRKQTKYKHNFHYFSYPSFFFLTKNFSFFNFNNSLFIFFGDETDCTVYRKKQYEKNVETFL